MTATAPAIPALVAELLEAGYSSESPDPETDRIDRANAARVRHCGRRVEFLPFVRGESYRIVLACWVCDWAEEA